MKWIEIITVRTAGTPGKEVIADILRGIDANSGREKPVMVKLFSHATVESDLSIHIQWEAARMDRRKSSIGLELAGLLGDFGLVNHSVWIEEKIGGES